MALTIGITYDLREDYLREGFDQEETAEFDGPETIVAIEAALCSLGYRTVRIGNIKALASCLSRGDRWDLVFNIAEGLEGYGREAQVPSLLDAYGISYTFSDPLTLTIALHKGIAKQILRDRGIRTPDFEIVSAATDVRCVTLPFPLFIKPVAEGSSKGISGASKVQDHDQLRSGCEELLQRFRQPVLVERYLPGCEFTVGILGTGADGYALGAMEVVLVNDADVDGYTYDNKEKYENRVRYLRTDGEQGHAAIRIALDAWKVLGGRDGGRVDLRCDEAGRVNVIEVNPLPGLHPIRSDLVILGRMHDVSHAELVGRIMASAERRMFSHSRQRRERAPS